MGKNRYRWHSYWAFAMVRMSKNKVWWRTHNNSVADRGSLQCALLSKQDYIRGARGLSLG